MSLVCTRCKSKCTPLNKKIIIRKSKCLPPPKMRLLQFKRGLTADVNCAVQAYFPCFMFCLADSPSCLPRTGGDPDLLPPLIISAARDRAFVLLIFVFRPTHPPLPLSESGSGLGILALLWSALRSRWIFYVFRCETTSWLR